jgi:hypothetical protein
VVTVEQYKSHEVGTVTRKSYPNTKSAYLETISQDIEGFSKNNRSQGVLFTLTADGSALQNMFKPYATLLTRSDIDMYAASKKVDKITDETYSLFAQDNAKLHITRK